MPITAILICLFRISCVILCCGAIIRELYRFSLDKDSVEIEILQEMNSAKYEFMPSLTFCFHFKQIHQSNETSGYPPPNTDDQLQDGYEDQILHIDDYIGNVLVKRKKKKTSCIYKGWD